MVTREAMANEATALYLHRVLRMTGGYGVRLATASPLGGRWVAAFFVGPVPAAPPLLVGPPIWLETQVATPPGDGLAQVVTTPRLVSGGHAGTPLGLTVQASLPRLAG